MDAVFCFVNTLMIGAISSAMYFLARDIERLTQRVEELEDSPMVLDDYEDDDEDEEEEDEEVKEAPVEEKKEN